MISSVLLENKTIKGVVEACNVLNKIFPLLLTEVKEGRSPLYIDQLARKLCETYEVEPAFLGQYGFPAAICISINNELAHGVPKGDRRFSKGDIVKLDFGVKKNGYYSDCARSKVIGKNKKGERLIKSAIKIFNQALLAAWPEELNTTLTLHMMMKSFDEKVHIFKEFCGHSIGEQLHNGKVIYNAGPLQGAQMFYLQEGDLLCIEPIIADKDTLVQLSDDKYTFYTDEGNISAHHENTVLITKKGPVVLTNF